jgi:hypothetical protein
MMLSFHDRPSGVEAFRFFLARELGMTVAELEQRMGHDEYLSWGAYYRAKQAVEGVRQ